MVYLLAFLLPLIIYGITAALSGIYPFGDGALLVSDINNQFAAFYTYFKHALYNSDNFIYTFSKSLGGDMVGFSGYYLRNPFLLLLVFFKDEYIPVGVVLIIGLMLACMSLSMAVLLKSISDDKPGIIVFSVSYAFMGYSMAYITLPIYFFDLILLPLVILGLRKLAEGKGKSLYIISLAFTIYCNYYIAYMICIFCLICFACMYTERSKSERRAGIGDFVISSLLAAGLTMFMTLPTVLSLKGQKEMPSLSGFSLKPLYSLKALIRNLFLGGFRGDLSNYSAPYIYVGEAVLLSAVIFFITGKITIKRKICAAIMLLFLIAGTYISFMDKAWHGMNEPVGFAHRQAFCICFSLIFIGFMGYSAIRDKIPGYVLAGFILVQLALLTANAVISVSSYDDAGLAAYRSYVARTERVLSRIKENDASFYRMEKDYEYNHNDSMLFSYNGLTHNSSCDKEWAKQFLSRMGIRYYPPIWTFYNQGSTAFADSFLGVRYLVSRYDWTNKPYDLLFMTEGTDKDGNERNSYVYKNPYAMPLCFGMKQDQLDTDMADEDLFMLQNRLAGENIYKKADIVGGTELSNIETDDLVSVDVKISGPCNLYFYATAPDYQGAELLVNDFSYEEYFSVSRWNIVNLGYYESGDTVNVKIRAKDGPIKIDEIFLCEEDEQALKRWYEKAFKEAGSLEKITGSHLKGSYHVEDSDRLVFTIPYEKGWKVWIDGKKVDTEECLDALLSIDAQKGDHQLEMYYIPEGLAAGAVISCVSLICCLIYVRKRSAKS